MNGYAWFIVISLGFKFSLELLANGLNLKALHLPLPAGLESLYDRDAYAKSQAYLRISTRFSLCESAFSLAFTLAFWFSGGFNFWDHLVRSWGFATLINGLVYLGSLFLVFSIIILPFSLYTTFVIEQRFGFNRTNLRTFIMDRVKMALLGIPIGGALVAGALALFQYTGDLAWVSAWIGVAIFLVMTQFIAPAWIMPLFNKFTPLAPGELKDAIMAYTQSVNYPVKNIYIVDGSRRSAKSNAYFTGFGANKRIALFDTLVNEHLTGEIVAVLAHEIGHYKKKHTILGLSISLGYTGLMLYLFSLCLHQPGLYAAFFLEQPSVYAGVICFGLLYTPLGLVFSLLIAVISRAQESAADRFAASTIPDPRLMASALKKLSTTNLSNLTPHPLYIFLNYSHPPLRERLRTVEKYLEKRP